jgi:DNA-binding MarR family transcriptional regulator
MKDEISKEEINNLDTVWHRLIQSMQKTSEDLWKDKLEGVSTVEISILSIIERKPDVILKEIIEILGIPGSTLTNAIDRLEKRGLLRREISKRDRRSFGLELTEEGKLAQVEHRKGEEILWHKVLNSYNTTEERSEFIRLLKILADSLFDNQKDGDNNAK